MFPRTFLTCAFIATFTAVGQAQVAVDRHAQAGIPFSKISALVLGAQAQVSPAQVAVNRHLRTPMPAGTAFTKLADGFDFPVGRPEAQGYYKARGFRPNDHLGEDWDGVGGGDSDLNDPVNSIGEGVVVFARDVHRGWGNVIIVRHTFREAGFVQTIDALYGHLNRILVAPGKRVARGQQIGTMGTAHGRYDAHLHFEIRKNLEIGINRAAFPRDFTNYYDPTKFIAAHRRLERAAQSYPVALNTFTHDAIYGFNAEHDIGSPHNSSGGRKTAKSAQFNRFGDLEN